MNLDFTLIDVLVVLAIILSAIFASVRGFVNETLSIFAWAAAAFATLYFAPGVAPFLRERMSTPLVGTIVAYVGIFLVVLIPLSFISHRFSENVKHSPVGVVDRILGAIFGVVRGLAVVGIAYIVFSMFVPVHQHPHVIRDARLLPLIRASSDVLLTLVPDQHLHDIGEASAVPNDVGPDPQPAPHEAHKGGPGKHGHKKYGAVERRALDNLIQTTGNGDASQ